MTRDELAKRAKEFVSALGSNAYGDKIWGVMADFAMEAVRTERKRIAKQIQRHDGEWKTIGKGNEFFRDFMLRLADELEKNND